MTIIEKIFPSIVFELSGIELNEANDEVILESNLSLENSLSKIKDMKEMPADYLEFIDILISDENVLRGENREKYDLLSSLLRIYVFSRAQKKAKDIKSWLVRGSINVSGYSVRLSTLSRKMKSYVKIIKTIKDTESRRQDILDDKKLKNKENKLAEIELKLIEIKAHRETLFQGIKQTAMTVETYLGAMTL